MNKHENGYLTVFLSLIFGIVMSFVIVLVNGAALSATRAQSELVADLGMDSVFAEYNRQILNQYELFFIDSSYGELSGGIEKIRQHLENYISYNISPQKDILMPGSNCFLKLSNPYLEIEQASIASDNNAEVWKAQAIRYMKDNAGIGLVNEIKDYVDVVKGQSLDTIDVESELSSKIDEFEQMLNEKEILEFDKQNDDGISYNSIRMAKDKLTGMGVVFITMPKDRSISGKSVDISKYFTHRQSVNKGIGRHAGADDPKGVVDSLIYNEYLMLMCGDYLKQKPDSALDYEIEYILYGNAKDRDNLYAAVKRILDVRSAANFIYLITSDSKRQNEADTIAQIICTLLTVPELSPALKYIILCEWAIAEAVSDVRDLLAGNKVSLLKNDGKWKVSLFEFLTGTFFIGDIGAGGASNEKGLDYRGYLRILLALSNKDDIAARSLDVVEMDIRKTPGNANFRIDRCVDYLKVGFGFEDVAGHEFVFKKEMCYEPN